MREKLPKRKYRSAGGVVVHPAGDQVLVLARPERLDEKSRPEVRLPKGHIEPGENRREAALREVCEETGLHGPEILADLGHQTVDFTWKDCHYVRDESCFLMTIPGEAPSRSPEKQFKRMWLPWQEALALLTFEAEREWLLRAWTAWQEQRSQGQSMASAL